MARPKLDKDVAENIRKAKWANKLKSVKTVLELGSVKHFDDIFDVIPKSKVAKEMMMAYGTFKNKVFSPGQFTILELERLAEIFSVDYNTIYTFVLCHIKHAEERRKSVT